MCQCGQPSTYRVVPVEPQQVQGQSAQRGQHRFTWAALAVAIFMELGACEPVPAFNAPAVLHQLRLRVWRGAQADKKGVALGGGLAGTLAADDQLDDPAAARPGLGEQVRSLFGPECPSGVPPVTVL